MKDLKRQAVCMFAMLALVFTLAGCGLFGGGDKKALLGTWEATVDLAGSINADLKKSTAGFDKELADQFRISSFEVKLVYTFNKDDTYSIRMNQDVLNAAIEHLKDDYKDICVAVIEHAIAQGELDMTVEEWLESRGLDLDDYVESTVDFNEITGTFVDYFTRTGRWKAENGELYLSKSVRRDADELSDLYEITSGGLRLTAPEGSEDEMGIYPLLLQKA